MTDRRSKILFCIIALVYILTGCNDSYRGTVKSIKAENITDIIFEDDVLLPNKDFTWNMKEADFLSVVYGAETMDPESESFEYYRYYHSDEQNITTFTPPVSYRIDGIPCEADVMLVFDEKGLSAAAYSWVFEETEGEEAEKTFALLAENINSDPNIRPEQFELPDLSVGNTTDFPCRYSWEPMDGSDIDINLSALRIQGHLIAEFVIRVR